MAKCALGLPNGMLPLGIMGSGSSVTFLPEKICERTQRKHKGSENKFMRIHGKSHRKFSVKCYRGMVVVGTKTGCGTVYALDVSPSVAGLRVDAVLGRDILRHFRVTLDWKGGTGWLEE